MSLLKKEDLFSIDVQVYFRIFLAISKIRKKNRKEKRIRVWNDQPCKNNILIEKYLFHKKEKKRKVSSSIVFIAGG